MPVSASKLVTLAQLQAQAERVKQELTEYELVPEDWVEMSLKRHVETPSSMLFTGPSGKVATESYLCLPDVLIDIIETGASGNRSSFLI